VAGPGVAAFSIICARASGEMVMGSCAPSLMYLLMIFRLREFRNSDRGRRLKSSTSSLTPGHAR
jgi:hypothetical protein